MSPRFSGNRFSRAGSRFSTRPSSQRAMEQKLAKYEQIAGGPAVAEEHEEPKPSPLERIADIVSRVPYSQVGFLRGLEQGGLGQAFKQAGTEMFSGIGGLKGEKKTWGDYLEERGFGGGSLSSIMPWLYSETGEGWKVKEGSPFDPTLRGVVGLGLDIALDPITYMTVGTGTAGKYVAKFAEPLAGLGKTVEFGLSGPGKKMLGKLTEEELPDAVKFVVRLRGHKGPLTPDDIKYLKQSRSVNMAAEQVAGESARARIYKMMEEGATELAAPGGIGIKPPFAKDTITLVKGEKFKPVGAAMSRTIRWMDALDPTTRGGKLAHAFLTTGRSIDNLVNEVTRGARNIAGVLHAKSAMNGEMAYQKKLLTEMVDDWTKGWDEVPRIKDPVGYWGTKDGTLSVYEYAYLSRQMPDKYPVTALPENVLDSMRSISRWLDESFELEAKHGAIPKEMYRKDYMPLQMKNPPSQLKQLTTAARPQAATDFGAGRYSLSPYDLERQFATVDDLYDFVKARPRIKWEPRPELDIRRVLHDRGRRHIGAMGLKNFEAKSMVHWGLDKQLVRSKVFSTMMPELRPDIMDRFGEAVGKFVDPDRASAVFEDGLLGKAIKWGKDDDDAIRGLYWLGRIHSSENFDDLTRMLYSHRKELAEVDPTVVTAIREMRNLHLENYLNSFNEPFVRVGSGPWAGSFFPDSIVETMSHLKTAVLNEKEVRGMLAMYDWTIDLFKAGVTSIFPAFHLRNAYSNVSQNFVDLGLSALDPKMNQLAAALLAGRDGTLKGGKLGRYTLNEVRQLMLEHGIIAKMDAIFERQAGLQRHVIVDHRPFTTGRRIGGAIENHARALNFMTWIKRGLSPEEAALRTKRVLFDYDALSNAERQVMRRLFPFYTWTKKNVALQAHFLRTKPGLALHQLKMDPGEQGPDESLLPDYLEGRFKIKVQRKGNLSYLTGVDLPITSGIETVFGTGRGALVENLSSVNPVLSTIIEMGTGRDLFTGRSIEERENLRGFGKAVKVLPKPIQKFLEFEEYKTKDGEDRYSMNGLKAYILFKSFALSRLYSYTRKLDEPLDSWALNVLTGLGIKEFDLSKSEELNVRMRLRRLEEHLKRKGKLYAFEVTGVRK